MTLSAAHVGINKYPAGNALAKCVSDAEGLAAIFGGVLLLDKKAKRDEVKRLVTATTKEAAAGKWFVITASGHGSQRKDRNADEPDGLDETFVTVELDEIIDDEVPAMFAGSNKKRRGLAIFDSCFSGNMHRAFSVGRDIATAPKLPIRYLPPSKVKPKRRRVTNAGNQRALDNTIVFSACADHEFAYEGETNGVWTDALIKTYDPSLTIGAWFVAASKIVADGPYGMVQHPQISGSKAALKWRVPSL